MNRFLPAVALLTGALSATVLGRAQMPASPPVAVTDVLARLAERTQQYYDRFISIICTETVNLQDLKSNLAPTGKPRLLVFELSVARDLKTKSRDEFRVERTLTSVNGKAAKKNQEPGCTDPRTGTPDPLEFLLAHNQSRFRFTLNGSAAGGPAGTRALDFMQPVPDRIQIKWTANCFNAEGGGQDGRVWFDPETLDVLQIDARLAKPFNVPVPGAFGAQPAIRVVRSDMTVRFARVKFEHPDETVLLPESIDTLTVFSGAPSLRTSQKLSNYRRFLSESTILNIAF